MPELTEQTILEKSPRLDCDAKFNFRCDPSMDCFNSCCSDVAILLSPYDVLRLKRALRMDSTEFLEKYTLTMRSKEKGIPVLFLRMDGETKKCPFVAESGCQVYAHRPWACRMYPLGMAEPKGAPAVPGRFYFLVQEQLCHGHGAGQDRSVRQWIDQQGVDPFDQMQGRFLELMSHPGWDKPELLTQEKLDMYFMTLYDLDRFRRFVSETRFLELFEVEEARIDAIAEDDEELLEFAIDWLAFSLFYEKRMRLRKPPAAEPAGNMRAETSCSPSP